MTPPTSSTPEIMVVMPVFNEEAAVRKVVTEWFGEMRKATENFVFVALDDGSTDQTPGLLARLVEELGPRLEVVRHANRGHGQTCLAGYRLAAARGIPFVFQIDSDDQCDPQYFFRIWRLRADYDVIYGKRVKRDDGWLRALVSLALRVTVAAAGGAWCEDANAPYRLMRTPLVAGPLARIPPDFVLANVALAVLLKRDRTIRHGFVPIRFRERYGGEPKVPLRQFGGRAVELVRQLRSLDG
jgi:dolichol-phosphate mannosyltransferase